MHFDADRRNSYSLNPIAFEGTSDPKEFGDRFNNVLVYPVIGGRGLEVLDMWNEALAYSFYLKHMNIPFDRNGYKSSESSINCRAGVIAVLDSIGVDRDRGYYAGDAGTKCDAIPLRRGFSSAVEGGYFETVCDSNERLLRSLGANFYINRYVGPAGGTLFVISP